MTSMLLAAEVPGAAPLWTSNDATIVKARTLVNDGQLKEAEHLLAGDSDPVAGQCLETIHWIRSYWDVPEARVFEQLREKIPSVSADQLAKWRASGDLFYRALDGQICYCSGSVGNLFRRSAEARKLRGPGHDEVKKWNQLQYLTDVVEAAAKTDAPALAPKGVRVDYQIKIDPLPDWVKSGSVARVWLPYPQENRQQTELKLLSSTTQPTQIAPNGCAHRTVYFEIPIVDPKKPLVIGESFQYVCSAWYPKLDDGLAQPLKANWNGKDLGERLPHIAFTPEMKATVADIVGTETNPLKKARLIFYWISQNIPWCSEMEYGIVPSLSIKGLSARTGDCGVQGCLFITMARVAGIPARWQTGWQLRPGDSGMHDWAEFYCEPWGWLPVDASYGLQKSDNPAVREFYLGHQDSYRMTVNTDYGQELIPPKESLRSEPVDFQRGEVEIDGRNLYFDQWDYDFQVETSEK